MALITILIVFCIRTSLGASKQFDYVVENERIEITNIDKSQVSKANCSYVKFNRTTTAINVDFEMIVNQTENSYVTCQIYKFVNNEYRLYIIQFKKQIKEILGMTWFDLRSIFRNHCTPPLVWPVRANVTYRVRNYAPDSTNFPALIPIGRYMAKIDFYIVDDKLAGSIEWYLKTKEVPKWRS